MILEELIYFDQEKLRKVNSLFNRLSLTKAFFSNFPTISNEKLMLFITMLKEREVDEKPYTFPLFYKLLSTCLALTVMACLYSFLNNSRLARLNRDLLTLCSILAFSWIILRSYVGYLMRRRKYARLIEVLEYYYLEREEKKI